MARGSACARESVRMTRRPDRAPRADLARARDVIEVSLAPRAYESFRAWTAALLAAVKALVHAERGGLLLRVGRWQHWMADDPQPVVVAATDDEGHGSPRAGTRAHSVSVAVEGPATDARRRRIVAGLRLSWTCPGGEARPEHYALLVHQATPADPALGQRERALLDLVAPAIRAGLEQARCAPGAEMLRPPATPNRLLHDVVRMAGGDADDDAALELSAVAGRWGLTPRQAEVALLMGAQRSHKEIAGTLGISPNTARRHEERVLKVLGVSRRTDVLQALAGVPRPHGRERHKG